MREWGVLHKTHRELNMASDLTRPILSNMPTSKGSLNMTQTTSKMAGPDSTTIFNKDLFVDGATWNN